MTTTETTKASDTAAEQAKLDESPSKVEPVEPETEPTMGIGEKTYHDVEALIAGGMRPTEAFVHYAQERKKSAATVATSYYRFARKDPNSRVQPRPHVRRQATGTDSSQVISEAKDMVAKLVGHIEKLESDLEQCRRDANEWNKMQAFLKSR